MAESARLIVALDLQGRKVTVVGGGAVAQRKVVNLLAAGANVVVIAPELTAELRAIAADARVFWAARTYVYGDLATALLAFAATDLPEVNEQVAAEARERGIFCNVAAPAESGDLHSMATIQRDQVTIAIGTSGASPYAAARLKEQIERAVPVSQAALARLMGELRQEVSERIPDQAQRRAAYERMWSSGAAAKLAAGDEDAARAIVREILEDASAASNPPAPRPPGSAS